MGSSYIPPPEQNVVNVGDEISINALNGIAQANPAITSTNPVATDGSVTAGLATKANLSHAHAIGDVTGLQTALNGKAATSHTHSISDVTSLQTSLNAKANLSGATFTGLLKSEGTFVIPQDSFAPTNVAQGQIWHDGTGNVLFGTYDNVQTNLVTDFSLGLTLSSYAQLSGATFTGKIIGTPTSARAAINIGTVAATPTSPVNGDIWIGTTLNFRASDGSNRPVPVLNSGNVFNATTTTIPIIQAIQGATSSQPAVEARHLGSGPALLISQRGTGDALRIDDENPDSTPFIIDASGKVGIGGVVPVSPSHKVAIHGGSIVFTSGHGIAFGDGTSMTTFPSLATQAGFESKANQIYLAQNFWSRVNSWSYDETYSTTDLFYDSGDNVLYELITAYLSGITITGGNSGSHTIYANYPGQLKVNGDLRYSTGQNVSFAVNGYSLPGSYKFIN